MGSVLSRIHYRAKSKKDPKLWVYGNLLDIKGDKMILNSKTWGISFEGVEIIPKTIGQWTGLLDRNKKKIYEDDVIKHPRQDRPYSGKAKHTDVLCLVQWCKGYDHSKSHLKNNPDLRKNKSLFNTEPGFDAYPIDRKAAGANWGFNWSVFHDCEVVGNIIDNPKLKKQ